MHITKIVCPSCHGTGRMPVLDFQCGWCAGEKRLSVKAVDNWSETELTFAIGGYIAGDYDLTEMTSMKASVRKARSLAGLPPHPDAVV